MVADVRQNIKILLLENRMTQQELAELLKINRFTLIKKMKLETEFKLSEILTMIELFQTSFDNIFLKNKSA